MKRTTRRETADRYRVAYELLLDMQGVFFQLERDLFLDRCLHRLVDTADNRGNYEDIKKSFEVIRQEYLSLMHDIEVELGVFDETYSDRVINSYLIEVDE